MTPDLESGRLDRLVRAADPAAGRSAPPVDDSPLALAAVRAGLTPPARSAAAGHGVGAGGVDLAGAGSGPAGVTWGPEPARPARGWVPVAASVTAVLAVVGLAALVGPGSGTGFGPGSAAPTSAPGPGGEGKPAREHTAAAGPEYERAERLLAALQDAVPAGYTVPDGGTGPGEDYGPTSGPDSTLPTIGPDGTGMPAAYFQAIRDEGPYEGYQGYEYLADTIVSDGPRVGSLAARVWKGVPAWSTDPCVVVHRVYWNAGERCEAVTTAGGARVAVVDAGSGSTDRRERQWAGLRRPDGTVVLVVQGPGPLNERIPGLARPVFSRAELAALAASTRFPAAVA